MRILQQGLCPDSTFSEALAKLLCISVWIKNWLWLDYKLAHKNFKCADAVCETSLVNCSLGSVKGGRVILQVHCRG